MYHCLWTNGGKECLEIPDYSYEEHYGKNTCSYPSRLAYADYIYGYVFKKHKLNENDIRLSTKVTDVTYISSESKFKVVSVKDS